ncbi:predicted protein [Nematostella vectensis]|uniref:Uncharacterized protein n=1 Tax=Nematostella vectensis TaxID=45351 RepID=A7SY81_NEMVE|nr:predicted protein [Nematostella vectensis]|eukprot:XP_001623430.1 predicted protein [Nematostella vectensis]
MGAIPKSGIVVVTICSVLLFLCGVGNIAAGSLFFEEEKSNIVPLSGGMGLWSGAVMIASGIAGLMVCGTKHKAAMSLYFNNTLVHSNAAYDLVADVSVLQITLSYILTLFMILSQMSLYFNNTLLSLYIGVAIFCFMISLAQLGITAFTYHVLALLKDGKCVNSGLTCECDDAHLGKLRLTSSQCPDVAVNYDPYKPHLLAVMIISIIAICIILLCALMALSSLLH